MEMKKTENDSEECSSKVSVKVPKRILHFSDGVLEEYSDDEVDNLNSDSPLTVQTEPTIDPKTMTWPQWLAFKAWAAGNTTLSAVDYMGESLAEFFGITTPKFQYEINEYYRQEEEKKKMEEDAKGWMAKNEEAPKTTQPAAAV